MPSESASPASPATQTAPPRRKAPHHLCRRRTGHHHEDDDAETVATDESYTDDDLSEEEHGSEDDSEDEFEDASDGEKRKPAPPPTKKPSSNGTIRTDTEVMLNGIGVQDEEVVEELDFEELEANGKTAELEVRMPSPVIVTSPVAVRDEPRKTGETLHDRKRREHDEYRKKRAEDPSFVPNRGRFFMHDHRDNAGGSNGFRPYGSGARGRGGGRFGYVHSCHGLRSADVETATFKLNSTCLRPSLPRNGHTTGTMRSNRSRPSKTARRLC